MYCLKCLKVWSCPKYIMNFFQSVQMLRKVEAHIENNNGYYVKKTWHCPTSVVQKSCCNNSHQ